MVDDKQYIVFGLDADEDIHVFKTDDLQKAIEKKAQFEEDLALRVELFGFVDA